MNKQDFLVELEDILQREEVCAETDVLAEYEEWDSLSKMSLMAFFDRHFSISLKLADLKDVEKVSDLIALAEGNIA